MLIKALREEFQTLTVETNYKSITEDLMLHVLGT